MDYHAIALQKWRLQQESARADVRDAMIRADRRDFTMMTNAEYDRQDTAKLKPAERVSIDLADLSEYDRHRFPQWCCAQAVIKPRVIELYLAGFIRYGSW